MSTDQDQHGDNQEIKPCESFRTHSWFSAAWRQVAIAKILELHSYAKSLEKHNRSWKESALASKPERQERLDGAKRSLKLACDAATSRRNLTGAAVECAWNNIHAAEEALLKIAPPADLKGWGYYVLAETRDHLKATDVRRVAMERLIYPPAPERRRSLRADDVEIALEAIKAAHQASTDEKMRARSFRNIVFAATFVLFVLACGLVALGVTSPGALNLCFSPSATQSQPGISALNVASALTACPSSDTGPAGPYDVLVVELIGMTAAALTAAVALRGIWGTATPYSIPFALTLLKLPAGAVSALLGLMLFNAALIPGLNRLATQGEILAWAAILGIGQQALTRFVDQKGQSVLNAIQGPGSNPAYPQDAAITVQDP